MAAGKQKPEGTAWRRRQQGTGKSMAQQVDEANQAIVRRARSYKAAAPAGQELPDNDLSADFAMRLARAEVFAKQHGLAWSGPCTHMMAVALVEQKAAKVSHVFKHMAARIAELEKVIAGQQKHVDHLVKHALVYAGEWQTTSTYYEGNLVSHKGALYTALKQIPPGKSAPSTRDGSGWALMA